MAERCQTYLNEKKMFLEIEVYYQEWTQNIKYFSSAKYDK